MEYRALGTSGLRISVLTMGTMTFGGKGNFAHVGSTGVQEARDQVDRCLAAGVNLIDTADVYSAWVPGHQGGESEAMIGDWLRTSGKRAQVQIATKVGMLPGEGGAKLAPARIVAACEASLRRLGVETIDLYYAHQDDDETPQEAYLEAFGCLHEQGKFRVRGLTRKVDSESANSTQLRPKPLCAYTDWLSGSQIILAINRAERLWRRGCAGGLQGH